MNATDSTQRKSVIEFKDKYAIRNDFAPYLKKGPEFDGEEVQGNIPELNVGERVVLNAWGSWEDSADYKDHRRRLGIYEVVSKEGEEIPHYILREEKRFSQDELAHQLLSGRFGSTLDNVDGLKYIALDRDGRALS